MTVRTNHKSPIEDATEQVLRDLNSLITVAHATHRPPIPEKQFRQILAGYFEQKTERDWCELLGIDPPDHLCGLATREPRDLE